MTHSNEENQSAGSNDNKPRRKRISNKVKSGFKPISFRVSRFLSRTLNKKPAYLITREGVEVHYFDFSNTDELPFDTSTYSQTQIFIGRWANPWYINIDQIEQEYPNFADEQQTEIRDIFGEEYIYPSQRWKILANQNVLRDMFAGGMAQNEKVMRLLYVVAAGLGFIAILLLFGGA